MKQSKTEYKIINVFSDITDEERKVKVNRSIRKLMIRDIEKISNLGYNEFVTFYGGGETPEVKEDAEKC